MAIDAIGGAGPATTATQAGSTLGLDDFLKILLTQLSYQDPLKPMDNQEFMAQTAQFTSLEQVQRLNDKLGQLISNQAALQSVGLIGRTVDIQLESGPVTGTVTSLSLGGDAPLISLATFAGTTLERVSLSQIIQVR